MKMFRKLATAVLAVVGSVSTTSAMANPSIVTALPDISSITARVGEWVASELKGQLALALSAPRVARPARIPSVTIFEGNVMVVEATRLPPENEHAATVANERALPLQF